MDHQRYGRMSGDGERGGRRGGRRGGGEGGGGGGEGGGGREGRGREEGEGWRIWKSSGLVAGFPLSADPFERVVEEMWHLTEGNPREITKLSSLL